MNDEINNFLSQFRMFLIKANDSDLYVYGGYNPLGLLMVKENHIESRTVFKQSESILRIGWSKISKFAQNKIKFRGCTINKYVFIGKIFRENAILHVKLTNNITLVELDIKSKRVSVIGSGNMNERLLDFLLKFSYNMRFTCSYDFEGILKQQTSSGGHQKIDTVRRKVDPTVFISYSIDSEEHQKWVVKLAADLIRRGVRVTIDEWDLRYYNNNLHYFMERGIANSDFVLMVCTPEYAKKADNRTGGVGIECSIITSEIYNPEKSGKYLPIVKGYSSGINECLPLFLKTKKVLDFNNYSKYDNNIDALLREILDIPKYERPTLGRLVPPRSIRV